MSSNKILLIGFAKETTLKQLETHLKVLKSDFKLLDFGKLRTCRKVELSEGPDSLHIQLGHDHFDLNQYQAFFCRHFYVDSEDALRNEAFTRVLSALSAYLETTPSLVINRPSAGASNASKLKQLMELREYGFKIPQSFIFGRPAEARKLIKPDGRWVSKGCSGTRTVVQVVDDLLYSKLDFLRTAPSQFQQRVEGDDVRVHVVGHQALALRIKTNAVDYRYAAKNGFESEYEVIETPEEIKIKCLDYARHQQLLFAGFDFKVDKISGDWYVLEVNPMPGYDFFDDKMDGSISHALGDLLCSAKYPVSRSTHESEIFIESSRRPTVGI